MCIAASSAQERRRKGPVRPRGCPAGRAEGRKEGCTRTISLKLKSPSECLRGRAGGRAGARTRAKGWSEAEQQLAGPLTLIKSQAVAAAAAHCASLDEIDVRSTTFCWTLLAAAAESLSLSLSLSPSLRPVVGAIIHFFFASTTFPHCGAQTF